MRTTSRPSLVAVILCLYVAVGAAGHGDALSRLLSFASGPHAVSTTKQGRGKSGGASLTQQRHLLLTVRSEVPAPAVLDVPAPDPDRPLVAVVFVTEAAARQIHLVHEQPARAPPMTSV